MQEFLERNNLWRDAADVVQLLRSTGGRLNEIVCIRLDQLMRTKRKLGLYATKTENQRDLPLWDCIKEIAQSQIKEGLTDGELLFPRAKTATFDNSIARACQKAAQLAKLSYGRTNGFSCHSLRHTFITDMMDRITNNATASTSREILLPANQTMRPFNCELGSEAIYDRFRPRLALD